MALFNVVWYTLLYNSEAKTHQVKITYEDGKSKISVPLDIDLPHLNFVVDMLRNEKPIWYDPDGKKIHTGTEEVGEEES